MKWISLFAALTGPFAVWGDVRLGLNRFEVFGDAFVTIGFTLIAISRWKS